MFSRAPWIVAAAVAVPLLLAGCSSPGTVGEAAPGATSAANAAEAESSAPAKVDTNASFGQTITYEDGLAVTVTDKGKFKPSEYAAKEDAKRYVKYQITLKNGTDEPFDPVLVYPTLQDGEEEASSVTDIEKKIGVPPSTKLLPGRTTKWNVAYGVNTKDLVMEVSLNDFDHESAIYTSK
jgi:outer membrane murein-binding lipoprotein Lpp